MWYVPGLVFGCVRRGARAEIAAQKKLRMSGERSKQAFLSASCSLRHFCTAAWDPGEKLSKVSEKRGSLSEATTDCARGNQHTKPALTMSCHPHLTLVFYVVPWGRSEKWWGQFAVTGAAGAVPWPQTKGWGFVSFVAFSGQVTFILNYVLSFPDKRGLLPTPSVWERLLCLGVQQAHTIWNDDGSRIARETANISHSLPPSHSYPLLCATLPKQILIVSFVFGQCLSKQKAGYSKRLPNLHLSRTQIVASAFLLYANEPADVCHWQKILRGTWPCLLLNIHL